MTQSTVPWSEEDDQILLAHLELKNKQLVEFLPHRSADSIRKRRQRLAKSQEIVTTIDATLESGERDVVEGPSLEEIKPAEEGAGAVEENNSIDEEIVVTMPIEILIPVNRKVPSYSSVKHRQR